LAEPDLLLAFFPRHASGLSEIIIFFTRRSRCLVANFVTCLEAFEPDAAKVTLGMDDGDDSDEE
jgi:hypothetical protein